MTSFQIMISQWNMSVVESESFVNTSDLHHFCSFWDMQLEDIRDHNVKTWLQILTELICLHSEF